MDCSGGSLADYGTILDSIADGVITVNLAMRITSFNRSAEKITRVSREDAIGRRCCEVMRAEICESDCCVKKTITTDTPCENVPVFIVRSDNSRIPISVTTGVMRDASGRVVGAVETFRDLTEINELRLACQKTCRFENIVSKNHRMNKLFSILPQVAESRSTLLIQGDSGTGKELVAKAIHHHGSSPDSPFIAINCGALPDTLIEAELFGYKAGAFTDARRDRPGYFEMAGDGTIFLDEIGDISPATQIRLLRVLQNRTVTPLGSTEKRKINARVITATHRDLTRMVKENRFRQDLFFRINVICLRLPTLAERKEDIPLLVDHFVQRFNTVTGKCIAGVSDDVLATFALHDWPGNVRELENAIEHAFILCRENFIGLPHLPEHIRSSRMELDNSRGKTLKAMEKQAIQQALHRNDGRRMATAKELCIDKGTLRRKIQYHRIDPTRLSAG